ncbi:hypothetical protein CJP74_02075 [Psittacicella melopsittaci]|uniref:Major facilitator superfamily (MFS) profile domain-containing protein n=1 Tax=Psittacicella melopsittaci TaxID=2028576 RepID=A0A3A1Y518_9GAMM|nr:MFS transporter [Psittacicella melopsittaci]RIY33343.1 hypothetical protein CJP74_02075 [Psittacicella melopsittaci]
MKDSSTALEDIERSNLDYVDEDNVHTANRQSASLDTGKVGFEEISPFQRQLQSQLPRSFYFFTLMYFICMFAGFVNNSFAPAIEALADDFQVKVAAITAIISLYTIGNGAGQLIWGPIMDRWGRKPVILICGYVGIALNLWIMNASSYSELVFIRILQGLSFSGLGVIPSIIIRDCFSAKKYAIYSSILSSLFVFTPVIAPLIGAWIYLYLGWQAIFGILSIVILIVLIFFTQYMPETLDPEKRQPIHIGAIGKKYLTIFQSPRSLGLIVINSIFTVSTVVMPTMLPMVYIVDYHVDPANFAYLVLINTLIMALGLNINSRLLKSGVNPAKIWLWAAIIQALSTLVSFFVIFHGISLLGVVIALGISVFFTSFIIGNMTCLFFLDYNNMIGTASSIFVSTRLCFAGLVVALLAHIPSFNGITLLLINALTIILSAVLIVVYYHRYRPDIRVKQNSDHFVEHPDD